MSAKCLDQQGRWRNKVVAFRMSPEEDELLKTAVRLSGLTKQEYIIRRLQEKEVVVTGNPRVYKALKNELAKVLNCRISDIFCYIESESGLPEEMWAKESVRKKREQQGE